VKALRHNNQPTGPWIPGQYHQITSVAQRSKKMDNSVRSCTVLQSLALAAG